MRPFLRVGMGGLCAQYRACWTIAIDRLSHLNGYKTPNDEWDEMRWDELPAFIVSHGHLRTFFLFYFYESTLPVIIAYKGFLLLFLKKKNERERESQQ